MRFSIGDMLITTLVVALTVLAFLKNSETQGLIAKVNDARENVTSLKKSVRFSEMRLSQYGPKMDYIRQLQLAVEPAIANFETVRDRYGKVEPEPKKVVVRSVPEYKKNNDQTYVGHWRISVPSEQPVYLRSGIRTKDNDGSDFNLDNCQWLKDSAFLDTNAYEIQLEPGINDFWMFTTKSDASVELRLQLGDQQLLSTEFTGNTNGRSWSGPSGRTPFSFSLAKRNTSLMEFSFYSDSPRYNFWIWFSSNPNAEGFMPFPVTSKALIVGEQKTLEATADE